MSKQEILAEVPNLTRSDLEQVDVCLHELLGQTGGKSPKFWGEALLEIAGTAQGLPADYAHNHDYYLHSTIKR
jgi:hypothetical protein